MAKGTSFAIFLVFLTAVVAILCPVAGFAEPKTWTADDSGRAVFREIQTPFIAADNTPPTISIYSPRELTSPDCILRASSVTVVWWAYDAMSGVAYYEIRLDDGVWANAGFIRTYSTFADATFVDLSDGPHTIDIKAVDHAGNVRQERYEFVVDTLFFRVATVIIIVAVVVVVGVVLFLLRRRLFPRRSEAPRRLVR